MAGKAAENRRDAWSLMLQIVLVVAMTMEAIPLVGLAYMLLTGGKLILPPGVFEVYDLICNSMMIWAIGALVAFMVWIYHASKSAHAATQQKMEFSPGWAVGWFFVPLASLVQPYFVMSELYNASRNPAGWKQLKRPPIVGIWWSVWVVASIIGLIARFSVLGDDAQMPLELAVTVSIALLAKQAMGLLICTRIANGQKMTRRDVSVNEIF